MQSRSFFGYENDSSVAKSFTVGYYNGGDVPGTAVVRIHTQSGFIIAADGLRRNLAGTTISDKQQKIFGVQQAHGTIAYALTGITYMEEGGVVFSTADAVAKIAKELMMEHFTGADRYVRNFGKMGRDALRKAQKDGKIQSFQDIGKHGLIVSILLAGYIKMKPFMAELTLSQRNQKLEPVDLSFRTYSFGMTEIKVYGSEKVFNEIVFTDNSNFAQFRDVGFFKLKNKSENVLSESEAIEVARKYITACSSPAGREFDPECEGIGGHIHIATITRDGGFKWVDPPLEIDPSV